MADIVYVNGDDWCGIYADGELVMQDHDLRVYDIFKWLLEDSIAVSSFSQIEADLEWLDGEGSLPEALSDVQTA